MKVTRILSITGVMLMSTQLNAAVVENNQIMPPPGPYKSIMSNTPPAFVPYGSQQAQNNPYQQNQASQAFNRFPANNQPLHKPAEQLPEWVVSKQQENKARIEKMLEENAARNKENEKRFTEYLEKAEALAKKRNEENKKWVAENNKKMKEFWQSELDKFAKNQKLQIEKAKDLPDWVKKNMLERQQKQLAVMKENPPMPMQMPSQNSRQNLRQNSMQRNPPSMNEFNNMQQSPPAHQMPSSMQFRQPPLMQQHQQQQPGMNQPFNSGQQNMPRQFMQQPRQAPPMQQQYRSQPFYNTPENRQFVPPVQGPYSGAVSGQPNINPYNRYSR
ncbi:MAG: hypothetical protein OQK98_05770 [Gammaproteobacteria bacterium]|nr:hypothetical protein [Gammaproteobacteria bacterium]